MTRWNRKNVGKPPLPYLFVILFCFKEVFPDDNTFYVIYTDCLSQVRNIPQPHVSRCNM